MKKYIPLFLIPIIFSHGVDAKAQVEWTGFFRHYEAVRTSDPNDFMILRNRLRLNAAQYGDRGTVFASIDFRNDPALDSREVTTDLREAYIDLYFNRVDFRIGKQQVVWGKTDGLFVNDILNPLDLEIFILQDFEDIRIGMPAVKADFFIGDNTLEAIWLPVFEPVHLASPGSDWEFNTISEEQTAYFDTVMFLPPDLPETTLGNSEYGFKYSTFISGIDLSLIYLRTRDDIPAMYKTIVPGIPEDPLPGSVTLLLEPQHHLMNVYGGNFSTAIKQLVFRGEGGIYQKRYFDAGTPGSATPGGLMNKPFLQYALGADIPEILNVSSGVQFIEQRILDYNAAITQDESTKLVTLLMRSDFLRETLTLTGLMLYDLSGDGQIIRLFGEYNLMDGVQLTVGADFISGKADNFFGQFADNDLAYFKLKYSF